MRKKFLNEGLNDILRSKVLEFFWEEAICDVIAKWRKMALWKMSRNIVEATTFLSKFTPFVTLKLFKV